MSTLQIRPHPDRVVVMLKQKDRDNLFRKPITRKDGSVVNFFNIESLPEFDEYYKTTISVGTVVAIGENVTNIQVDDKVILSYLVDADNADWFGSLNGDRLLSVLAKTTYHEEDSVMGINGMFEYVKGDVEYESPIYAVVRGHKIKPLFPYIILDHFSNEKEYKTAQGLVYTEVESVVGRPILSAASKTGYKEGDTVFYPVNDSFQRVCGKRILDFVDFRDILIKKTKIN